MSEQPDDRNRWKLIAGGAILFATVAAIIIYMVASYKTDEQIADHAASCTIAKSLYILRGLGGTGAGITTQDLINKKFQSIEYFQKRAEQNALKNPSISKREYLMGMEEAAWR